MGEGAVHVSVTLCCVPVGAPCPAASSAAPANEKHKIKQAARTRRKEVAKEKEESEKELKTRRRRGAPTGTVSAERIVLATNGYTGDLWSGLRRSVVPLYSAIVASEPVTERFGPRSTPIRIAPVISCEA